MYTPHTLVAFGGTLTGTTGKDVWQCGIRGGSFNSQGTPFGHSDAFITQLYPDLSAWFTGVAQGMHLDASLDWLKINDIGADGKYIEATTHRHDYSPVIVPSGTGRNVPAYMSLCYTFGTAKARGRAHKGRIYPPNGGLGVAKGSETAVSTAAACAASGELLLSKIVNASDVATTGVDKFDPCVYSAIDASFNRITTVSCDCLFDEQHRRKEQTVTTRSTVNVDYTTH